MAILEMINQAFKSANNLLDFVFFWGGWLLILEYPLTFFAMGIYKNLKNKRKLTPTIILDLFSQAFILLVVAFLVGLIWSLPDILYLRFAWSGVITADLFFRLPNELVSLWTNSIWLLTYFRWVEVTLVFLGVVYYFAHEHGEKRWLYSWLGHTSAIFLGLIFNRWMGLFFITIPTLFSYYASLYSLAIILVPVANPDSSRESWKRFIVFAAYTWGLQFPMIVIDGHAWKKPETRIPGDFTWDYPVPGLVWTKAHQVVAITSGTKFKRLDGPGLAFTGKMERPFQVFDLRLQLRTNEIDVVSKDGVSYKARVFTAFRLDPETWDKTTYEKLRRTNHLLRGADKLSHTQGSFPFSHQRIQATLGVTSSKAGSTDALIYWDQWVLNVVENSARKVLSQKNLDELWRPAKDEKFANALDGIANEIKDAAFLTIRSVGILPIVARVVNFRFDDLSKESPTDNISMQQLTTWGSEWERKRANILSEAQAEAERSQQEARAYAESILLNSIADGLQKAKDMDPNLPRYVIAMRFLSSLQDYIHKQPAGKDTEEILERFKDWKDLLPPD
jgi:regulator of protease activity HflC (stomatin/prohibitin superfamily)